MILNNHITKGARLKCCALLFLCSICGAGTSEVEAHFPGFVGLESVYTVTPDHSTNATKIKAELISAREKRLTTKKVLNNLVRTLWRNADRKVSIREKCLSTGTPDLYKDPTSEEGKELKQIEQEQVELNKRIDEARQAYTLARTQHIDAAVRYRDAVGPYDMAEARQRRDDVMKSEVVEAVTSEEHDVMSDEHHVMCKENVTYCDSY
ncbi:MAG: hypothetical protein LBQ43_05320 [Holosporales bacterium]|jgi:chromosome segregation ATPase|nr:hypothetical protein [Holosporales bacterium]